MILFVAVSFAASSQTELKADQIGADWTLITSQEGIEMYVQEGECKMGNVKTPFTYGFLRIVNTSSEAKNVSFNINLYYADGCAGCDNHNEEYTTVSVAANSSIETDCSFENGQLALLIRNPLQADYQDFKYLQLMDLKVY